MGETFSPRTVTSHFALITQFPFLSHLARFKCHICRPISHEAIQARFNCKVPRSEIGAK